MVKNNNNYTEYSSLSDVEHIKKIITPMFYCVFHDNTDHSLCRSTIKYCCPNESLEVSFDFQSAWEFVAKQIVLSYQTKSNNEILQILEEVVNQYVGDVTREYGCVRNWVLSELCSVNQIAA